VKSRRARLRARKKMLVAAVFLSFLVLFAAVFVYFAYQKSPVIRSSQPRAALVDQLSLTFPNATFAKTATSILKQAGYLVDYFPGENVTVDFYRNLLSQDYGLIIFRVHCGFSNATHEIAFFTAQAYVQPTNPLDPLYGDVLYGRVGTATYHDPPEPGETAYCAIREGFVEQYGSFTNTTVIVMGCYGLMYTGMAQAFINKGARVYIGWSGLMDADHSDEATIVLLRHLLLQNETVSQAVQSTKSEVGADPSYPESLLGYYPTGSGSQKLADFEGTAVRDVAAYAALNVMAISVRRIER
jgi:hypothetical protein